MSWKGAFVYTSPMLPRSILYETAAPKICHTFAARCHVTGLSRRKRTVEHRHRRVVDGLVRERGAQRTVHVLEPKRVDPPRRKGTRHAARRKHAAPLVRGDYP